MLELKGTKVLKYVYADWAKLKLYALPVFKMLVPQFKRVYDLIYSQENCLQG